MPSDFLGAYRELVPGSRLPDGARIAAMHRVAATGVAASTFVMKRRTAGWEYLVVDSLGRREPGDTTPCSTCHAEAPADSLFGVPRGAERN